MFQRLATEADAVEALYATGHWLLSVERLSEAKDVFRTMLVIAPRDERGWLGLGHAHEGLADVVSAAKLYALASATLPTSVRCRVAYGRIMKSAGHLDAADDALCSALDLADGDDELCRLVEHERGLP
jgi:Flp pilus assembly protein TadD